MSEDNFQTVNGYQDDNTAIASPAAQTFTVDTNIYLHDIALYFLSGQDANLDTPDQGVDDTGITMEIRNVVDDHPGNLYYGRTSVPADSINTSKNADAPTKFIFNDPVFLKANTRYAFVLYTKSTNFELAVSKYAHLQNRNGTINTESNTDTENPIGYVGGSFYYSMNGRDWASGDPDDSQSYSGGQMCLKFTLNRCDFDTDSTKNTIMLHEPQDLANYTYNDGTAMNNLSFLTMSPKMFIPSSTNVTWEYTLNDPNEKDAIPFKPNHAYNVDKDSYNQMYIWAKLQGTDQLTPVIARGSLALNAQLTNTDTDGDKDTQLGMQINGMDIYNPFFTDNDDTEGAGDYLSRNIRFTDTGNKATTFNQIYASFEFMGGDDPSSNIVPNQQINDAPRPDLFVNLNADGDPASENPFRDMWIEIPGYDEVNVDASKGSENTVKTYYTVDPFYPTQVMTQDGNIDNTDDNFNDKRSYSERATGGDQNTAWYRYHYHLSIPRLLKGYYPHLQGQGVYKTNILQNNPNNVTSNLNEYASEAKFKIVLHASDHHTHPKVRKFLTTVNRSDEDESNTDY